MQRILQIRILTITQANNCQVPVTPLGEGQGHSLSDWLCDSAVSLAECRANNTKVFENFSAYVRTLISILRLRPRSMQGGKFAWFNMNIFFRRRILVTQTKISKQVQTSINYLFIDKSESLSLWQKLSCLINDTRDIDNRDKHIPNQ